MKAHNLGRVVGLSAYEIAVSKGYEGSIEEWLESLRYDHSDEYKQFTDTIEQARNEIETGKSDIETSVSTIRNLVTNALTDIENTRKQGVDAVNTAGTSAVNEIENKKSDALTDINSAESEALTSLASTLDSAIRSINEKGTRWEKQIEDTGTLTKSEYNQNANAKQKVFDENAEEKQSAFDQNAELKQNAYDQNFSEKTTAFDTHVSETQTALDNHIKEKQDAFDDNATEKQTTFDQNAEAKQTAYDQNAEQKIQEYDTHTEQIQSDISQLKEDLSNKITKFYASNQGENHLADSDSGKIMDMLVYGKSEQKQYTGKNLLKLSDKRVQNGNLKFQISQGIITLSGSTDNTSFNEKIKDFIVPSDGTYTISTNSDSNNDSPRILLSINGASFESALKGVTKKLTTADVVSLYIRISTAGSYDGRTIKPMIEKGSEVTSYEPYTGGQPSPSPDYPQGIKSVVNPTVKVSNEDGTKSQTVTLPYALNAIPVSSSGNVTIDGQQYVADYVDVERGKIIRKILKWRLTDINGTFNNNVWHINISDLGIDGSRIGLSNMFKIQNHNYAHPEESELYIGIDGKSASLNMRGMPDEEFKKWLSDKNPEVYNVLNAAEEIPITPEEASAFKQLMTYYPVTNISANSEQLDGYTVFNYPISMANGWNYVKQQLNDNRDYIYDMDLQSAEAYVNSEYAVALTELEV